MNKPTELERALATLAKARANQARLLEKTPTPATTEKPAVPSTQPEKSEDGVKITPAMRGEAKRKDEVLHRMLPDF